MIVLTVASGLVDLTSVRASHAPWLSTVCPDIRNLPHCSVLNLLMSAPCLTRDHNKHLGILDQLIWMFGSLVESKQAGVRIPTLNGGAWFEQSNFEFDEDVVPHRRASYLLAYAALTTEAQANESVMGYSLDDSRLGRQPWKLIAGLAPARNLAWWCFPQVLARQ